MPKGLEGVVAANSSICYIDGDAGVLAYRGIDIHELAQKSSFEETCYLLWFGRLPKRAELDDLNRKLAAASKMDPAIYDMMAKVPKAAPPMEVLRTAFLRRRFKSRRPRFQRAQGHRPDLADRHDRGRLRSHPQRQERHAA